MLLDSMGYFEASLHKAVTLESFGKSPWIEAKVVHSLIVGVEAAIFADQIGYTDKALWSQFFGQIVDKGIDILDVVKDHGADDQIERARQIF